MVLELHDFAAKAKPYAKILDAACVKHGYSQLRAFTQIAAESGWDPNAQSGVGAIGICQIMPETALDWGCNPHDPASSIDALVEHMAAYVKGYKGRFDYALAAYNAGEGAVEQWNGVPPYPETEEYVAKITGTVANASAAWPAFWKSLLEGD